jgi:hypothetical protein
MLVQTNTEVKKFGAWDIRKFYLHIFLTSHLHFTGGDTFFTALNFGGQTVRQIPHLVHFF